MLGPILRMKKKMREPPWVSSLPLLDMHAFSSVYALVCIVKVSFRMVMARTEVCLYFSPSSCGSSKEIRRFSPPLSIETAASVTDE